MYSNFDSGDAGRTDTFAFYVDFSLSSIFAKNVIIVVSLSEVNKFLIIFNL